MAILKEVEIQRMCAGVFQVFGYFFSHGWHGFALITKLKIYLKVFFRTDYTDFHRFNKVKIYYSNVQRVFSHGFALITKLKIYFKGFFARIAQIFTDLLN